MSIAATISRFFACRRGVLFLANLHRLLALTAICIVLCPHALCARSPIFFESDPIEEEIIRIKGILEGLPVSPTIASPWTLGYASSWDDLPEEPLTIEITFDKPGVIDLVALMPSVYIDDNSIRQSFGFPVRFSIDRLLPDGSSQRIVDNLNQNYSQVGMGPALFPCANPVLTSGLRISVAKRGRNPTWWSTSQVVTLSEVFAFAGKANVALHGKVTATSSFNLPEAWSTSYLTDGFSLFAPINRKLSDPTKFFRALGNEVLLEMDLGSVRQIDEFRFWPVVQSVQHNFPPINGTGFPQAFRVELANKPDFSDARLLYDVKQLGRQVGGGPWIRRTEPVSGRFARIILKDGTRDARSQEHTEIDLAEIELLENGHLVSKDLPVLAPNDGTEAVGLNYLTDGLVSEGKILPMRKWLEQFHQQVALTQELRSLWVAAPEARIRDGKRSTVLLFVAAALIVALAQMVWLVRVTAHRRSARMRERIACDLHDEIGANVSSIAHTAELLKEAIREPTETQSRLLLNLIDSAQLTNREAKHFIRFIESEEKDLDLTEQFAQVANRILATIPTTFSLENSRSFNALDPATKWNLLLFYKEALNNIIKHAGATAVEIVTRRAGASLFLEISDNGCGISETPTNCRHLESRAKVLNGKLEVRSSAASGTRVVLAFNRNSKS